MRTLHGSKATFRLPALALAAVLLAACGGGGDAAPTPPPAPPPPVVPADTTPPSVPANLTATAASATRVDVAWAASTDNAGGSGLAGYRVFRDGAQLASVGATTTSWADTTVAAATRYGYTVRAFDAATPANVSAESAAVAVTTPAAPPVGGLDARPSNTSCVAPARPQPAGGLRFDRAFANLSFPNQVGLFQAPGSTARWYVVVQGGTIRSFPNDPAATTGQVTTFLDITARVASGGERGLLGLAFHPQWPTVPHAFVYYTSTATGNQLVVSRFRSTNGGTSLDPATEERLLTMTKNQADSNHNGGHLAFGPDGLLYVGTGDGGGAGDPQNNAQNPNTLFGKMLRIDVGTTTGYSIPAGNRWAANARCGATGFGTIQCAEIWAYGLRNPWKWSFDRGTGQLWLGDVGQGAREEVNVIASGANYGWRFREGGLCFNPGTNCPTTAPNGDPLVAPLLDYGTDVGRSVTGGYVYRGTRLGEFVGRYLLADFVSGRVFTFTPGSPFRTYQAADALGTVSNPSAFAEDAAGELYVLSYGGSIFALNPATGGTDTVAQQLSATGCVDAANPQRPAAGLIPYRPNAPFWSDGTSKERWLGLPNGTQIGVQANGDWTFPNGTVLVKNFRLPADQRLIETRLFMRHPDGTWAGYTYEWNDAQTDATRVAAAGRRRTFGALEWIYPSANECLQCHTEAAGRSLGLETAQLNGDLQYPQTGRTANQLVTLNAIGLLNPAITNAPAGRPAYPDPFGSAPLAQRARAYLHTNCAQCHQPGGPTPSTLDLRYDTALAQTNACRAPSGTTLGIANAQILAPGEPDRSVLPGRMGRRDQHAMPQIGSTVVDAAGVALVRQWIQSLASCQ